MKSHEINLPLVVRLSIAQEKFDPENVDAKIFCVNTTDEEFYLSTQSESFTTIDEEYGNTTSHGSKPVSKKLSPGESLKIAEVKGWEWDGHVGCQITFTQNKKSIQKSYNFKESKSDFKFSDGKVGRMISPI